MSPRPKGAGGHAEEDELFDPGDDSDLSIDADEREGGLDTTEGPEDGGGPDLEPGLEPRDDGESVRWSEGSEEAGDVVGTLDDEVADEREGGWTEGNDPDPELDAGLDELGGLDLPATEDHGEEGFALDDMLSDAVLEPLPPLGDGDDDRDGPGADADAAELLAHGPGALDAAEAEPATVTVAEGVAWSRIARLQVAVTTDPPRSPAAAGSEGPDLAALPPRVPHAEPALWVLLDEPVIQCAAAWPGHILHLREGASGPWRPKPRCADVGLLASDGNAALAVLCGATIEHSVDGGEHFEARPWPADCPPPTALTVARHELLAGAADGVRRFGSGRWRKVTDVPVHPLSIVREGPVEVAYGCVPRADGSTVVSRLELMDVRRPPQVVAELPGPPLRAIHGERAAGRTRLWLEDGEGRWRCLELGAASRDAGTDGFDGEA